MPFWWNRRRKPWYGRRIRRRRYTRRNKRRPRYYKRRRTYRTYPRRRRRRRRRNKVRRKAKKITVQQWQPDSINKCKIIGQGVMILGAEARQMRCYTDVKTETVRPRTPAGGGFGYEVYTLKYLYSEYKFHYNIWTKTNLYKDLCRYFGVKLTYYRHPKIDFIIQYDRQPPYNVTKFSYIGTHPMQLLQQKHHKILLSQKTKPNGKLTKTIFIKPPKMMIKKWFFTDAFTPYPLCAVKATAADFKHSYLSCCNENQQVGLYLLNLQYYMSSSWGNASKIYRPYATIPAPTTYYIKYIDGKKATLTLDPKTYNESVSYETGYFQTKLMRAFKFYTDNNYTTESQAAIPCNTAIYNPNLDSGEGNQIWLASIHTATYQPPTTDQEILIVNLPLWLGLWGYFDYVTKVKKTNEFLKTHVVCIKSKAIQLFPQVGSGTVIVPIDQDFINGQAFFNQPPTYHDKRFWYPTCEAQQKTLNAIVETGPFVPKLSTTSESTWELKYKYCFYFKWGGPHITDPEVLDPATQGHYDLPNTVQQTIQIKNPEKQKTESFIHQWDIRRGFIKEAALKRMYDNLSIDTSFQAATEEEEPKPKKRKLPTLQTQEKKNKKINQCLQDLFKENTFQESETQSVHQLIQQQQQQQQELKKNIFKLLLDLKHKQQMLQLQTGLVD
nr:MAG: ORF1 [Torque teno midi virus]